MIETGTGIFQLQKFPGHRHLTTTLVYVRLNEEKPYHAARLTYMQTDLKMNHHPTVNEIFRNFKKPYLQNTPLIDKNNFQDMIDSLFAAEWVVYLKESFQGKESVIEYLARYTHRIAISNHRIVDINNGMVRFKYRDYADENREKIMELPGESFIRRFMMHVVPKRFVRIRYFGLLSHRNKKKAIKTITKMANADYLPLLKRLRFIN